MLAPSPNGARWPELNPSLSRNQDGSLPAAAQGQPAHLAAPAARVPWAAIGMAAPERCRGHDRVESARRSLGGQWKTTTSYMITPLTPFQAGPALLARWARHH